MMSLLRTESPKKEKKEKEGKEENETAPENAKRDEGKGEAKERSFVYNETETKMAVLLPGFLWFPYPLTPDKLQIKPRR